MCVCVFSHCWEMCGVVWCGVVVALWSLCVLCVSAHEGTQPAAVRLALGDTRDAVTVTWATAEPTRESVVRWGPFGTGAAMGGGPLTDVARGAQRNFTDGGAEKRSHMIHTVRLARLVAGRRYSYVAGDPSGGWSDVFFFVAPRSDAQISKDALRIIAYCDMGDTNSLTLADVQEEVRQKNYDVLIHCGDFAYDLDTDNGRVGDAWMRSIEPVSAYLPYMVSPGNHEESYNFSHFKARFDMPGEQARATDNHYYSFDMGPAHIVAYNTEAFFWPQHFDVEYMRRMYKWLEEDLARANANRQAVPWIIVHGHRPMYCVVSDHVTGHCDGEQEASRRGIPSECDVDDAHLCSAVASGANSVTFPVEDLFFKYGVDLAFYGHVHDYERYWPVYNETVMNGTHTELGLYYEPKATVHVTTGSGGNPEMIYGPKFWKPPPRGLCTRDSPWCAFQSGYFPRDGQMADFTYSRLTVHNSTHLDWEQWSSIDEGVIDRFTVVQPRHGPFPGADDVAKERLRLRLRRLGPSDVSSLKTDV